MSIPTRDAIGSVLRARVAAHADRTCCAMDEKALTFGEMDARSDALAAGAHDLGVGPGDRVGLLATNRVELLELFFGLAKTGAIQVPLNAFIKGEFLRHQLAHSRSSVLITDAAGREAVEPLLGELPDLKTIVAMDEPRDGDVQYEAFFTAGETPPDVKLGPASTMSIIYTSGTTGLPKGCIASHGYYCRSADVIGTALELTEEDVLFAGLPLFHAGGRLTMVAMPLLYGIPAHHQATFSASTYFRRAGEVGATAMIAVGPMGSAVLATEPSPADTAHEVSRIFCAPLSLDAQRTFRDRFNCEPWVDLFGQSECMPVTCTPLSSDLRDPLGCGRAAPDMEVELLDDHGRVIAGTGVVGELCCRPREPYAMFDGYFDDAAGTLAAFEGLWYHTGDYGKRLDSGAFAFVDRKKDALRRRGENVSSVELEAAINRHPQVVESAVHAVPSQLGEDDIKVCLVAENGATPEAAAMFDYFKQHLPYFAIPRYVDVIDALPRNGVGRVMKHKLREAGNCDATWDFEALGLSVSREERR